MPESVSKWLTELKPLRVLVVGDLPIDWEAILDASTAGWRSDARWLASIPVDARPCVERISIDEVSSLPFDRLFDLAIAPALAELPMGFMERLLDEVRRSARFVITTIDDGMLESLFPPARSVRCGIDSPLLDRSSTGDERATLLRGGRSALMSDHGRIIYLSPNRAIHGGVKILYNHVDILNSIGIPAVLAVRESINWPASWFGWNPRHLVFDAHAACRVTSRDTVVIPEFRFRDVWNYEQAARRLIFVQNPGLCFDIEKWSGMGFDGVLTLGCPDGRKAKMHEWIEQRTSLPIFAISNHYSDDIWGKVRIKRSPGRILCLPRKGPEYIARLREEFPGIDCVDGVSQVRMAHELARTDVYVHTGFPEGQPMPPIEAMLSGCLVAGFTGGGGLDVMRDGQTAYVATDGDYEGLAASVRRALTDPQREEVRLAGQRLCRAFTREATAAELRACYTEWLPQIPAIRRLIPASWRRPWRDHLRKLPLRNLLRRG